mmetsp:Transcript_15701/g.42613  ORF Transcript_15701/g.42613 Transcript_15701/m.42613 type:complete len:213 (-) Transcript_15701:1318-1956(-)
MTDPDLHQQQQQPQQQLLLLLQPRGHAAPPHCALQAPPLHQTSLKAHTTTRLIARVLPTSLLAVRQAPIFGHHGPPAAAVPPTPAPSPDPRQLPHTLRPCLALKAVHHTTYRRVTSPHPRSVTPAQLSGPHLRKFTSLHSPHSCSSLNSSATPSPRLHHNTHHRPPHCHSAPSCAAPQQQRRRRRRRGPAAAAPNTGPLISSCSAASWTRWG